MTTRSGALVAPVAAARPDPAVEVTRVTSGADTDRFIKFQWDVYRGANDLHWVPPLLMERRDFLDPARNPYFQHAEVALFLARRGGQVVGRIAAMEDRSFNALHGARTACFGLYESYDDPAVAAALFGAARDWARWRGLDTLLGPMNLSTSHQVGLLVEGFDSAPYVLMPYNPRYYAALFEGCGLVKAKDLLAWERSARTPPPERFARIADEVLAHSGITVRGIDPRRFDVEVARIKRVYDAAWSEKSWGFAPMSEAELDRLAAELRPLLVPELALVVEHGGEPIAFSLTVPDVNQALARLDGRLTSLGLPVGLAKLRWYSRRIDRVRLMALAIEAGWQRRGVDAVLVVETIRRAQQLGYAGGEISWTLEEDAVVNGAIEEAGCVRSKRYRVYQAPTG